MDALQKNLKAEVVAFAAPNLQLAVHAQQGIAVRLRVAVQNLAVRMRQAAVETAHAARIP
jgi:hypothetical protein